MNQDEIIEMARRSNILENIGYDNPDMKNWRGDVVRELSVFAKLIAAKEREICAHICEILWAYPDNGMATEEEVYGAKCAGAIRSRGES